MGKLMKLFVMVGAFLLGTWIFVDAPANAGPAPPLTDVRIAEIWSDGSPNHIQVWGSRVPDGVTFMGTKLYVRTQFKGYPNWSLVFYSTFPSGSPLEHRTVSKVIRGNTWVQDIEIDYKWLGSEYPDLYVRAHTQNYNHYGAQEQQAMVTNIHLQWPPPF